MKPCKKNAPTLRFPGFSNAWELTSLSSIARIYDGTHQTPSYVENGIPFVSVEDIENIQDTTKFISPDAFEKDFKVKPRKHDILMTRITAGVIGATAIIENDAPLGFYVSLALIRPNPDVDPHFLRHSVESPSFRRELHKRIIHVAFPKKINLGDIGECRQYVPSVSEQHRIAAFLSAMDEKIGQLARKKELLLKYKKGVMQQIFDQKIRFKDDNGDDFPDWKDQRLAELGEFFSGGTPSTIRPEYFDGEIPFIRSAEINSNQTEQFISQRGLNNSSARLVKRGDLLYAMYGANSGEAGIAKIDGAINQAILCIRTRLDNRYLLNYLWLKKGKIVKTYLQGGQGNLSAELVKSFKVPVPANAEQRKIAEFLSALDVRTDVIAQQLERMKTFKQGLLQQMFV